jgi:hypothetical protein
MIASSLTNSLPSLRQYRSPSPGDFFALRTSRLSFLPIRVLKGCLPADLRIRIDDLIVRCLAGEGDGFVLLIVCEARWLDSWDLIGLELGIPRERAVWRLPWAMEWDEVMMIP